MPGYPVLKQQKALQVVHFFSQMQKHAVLKLINSNKCIIHYIHKLKF